MEEKPTMETSIIIPILNEEATIKQLLDSIHQQTYPKERFEIIFVDGGSVDQTLPLLEEYLKVSPRMIRIIHNSRKTAQHAMNLAIPQSRGIYIIRLDAHSIYPSNYFEILISALKKDAMLGNVGGRCEVIGKGLIGESYETVLSTVFGVGSSKFRTSNTEEYVNTVPFGAYRKDVLINIGMYNERLQRNEDYELNIRLKKKGYKILLKPDLVIKYQCRNTWFSIIKHEISDGIWNTLSFIIAPYTFSLSHFIPLFFVISILLFIILQITGVFFLHFIFLIEAICYLGLDVYYSLRYAHNRLRNILVTFLLYPLHHIGCGIGEIAGIFCIKRIRK